MNKRAISRISTISFSRPFRIVAVLVLSAAAALTIWLPLSSGEERTTTEEISARTVGDLNSAPPAAGAGAAALEAAPSPTATATPTPTQSPSASASSPVPTATKTTAKPTPTAPASKVLDHEFEAQINGYYCGPAAVRIALSARSVNPTQDELAAQLGTTVNGTNSAEDTTRVLNDRAGTSFYRTTMIADAAPTAAETAALKAAVVRAISKGYPVVANVVGTATDTDGVMHSYDGGHYLTVVGYRANGATVQIADPALFGAAGSYSMTIADLADWVAQRGYSA